MRETEKQVRWLRLRLRYNFQKLRLFFVHINERWYVLRVLMLTFANE
jgi:hypothetical protein